MRGLLASTASFVIGVSLSVGNFRVPQWIAALLLWAGFFGYLWVGGTWTPVHRRLFRARRDYPVTSLLVASLVGAILFGIAWWFLPLPENDVISGPEPNHAAPDAWGTLPNPEANEDWFSDLTAFRRAAVSAGFIEHAADRRTVQLEHYPSLLTVTKKEPAFGSAAKAEFIAELEKLGILKRDAYDRAISSGENLTLDFHGDVRGFGFSFQQGLYPVLVSVDVVDRRDPLLASGREYFPHINFIGFLVPDRISRIVIQSQVDGSAYLENFYIYAAEEHPRDFGGGTE